MPINKTKIDEIISLIRSEYPNWSTFLHPQFEEDEIKYKQAAVLKAHELLSEQDLRRLQKEDNFEEIIGRIKKVAQASKNLFWLQAPSSGDLSILEQPDLDKPAFCASFIDLIYGEGASEERMDRYLNFVKSQKLPNKWTVPSYFLFVCHPETEIFVKPDAMRRFLEFISDEKAIQFKGEPSGEVYSDIKRISSLLREELKEYRPRDMIDIQRVIFLTQDIIKLRTSISEALTKIFKSKEEAVWAFGLIKDTLDRLGVRGPDDERFVITLPRKGKDLRLNLDFGQWLILSFASPEITQNRVTITLIKGSANIDDTFVTFNFAQDEGGLDFKNYSLPIEMVKPLRGDLRDAYMETLDEINEKFGDWKRSIWRKHHVSTIGEAMFDANKLNGLLDPEGVRHYSLSQLSEDTGIEINRLNRWANSLHSKGQAIIYGPPGTGKTFLAERLARHLTSGGDGIVELVQFHPAYAYEDFVQGIRPKARDDGTLEYSVVPGRFLSFCQRACERQGTSVLIIDEINRANLASVFGELMYLLEYRNKPIPLASDGQLFQIPDNVRIIGTMNTADRSIALVDHALRRRFAFLRLQPDYEILKRYHEREDTGFPVDRLIEVLRDLNRTINDPHYELGISYFLKPDLREHIEDIWTTEIEPYLDECFFNNHKGADKFSWERIKPSLGL
jgi:5-methylcytosine-specific restriction protein B